MVRGQSAVLSLRSAVTNLRSPVRNSEVGGTCREYAVMISNWADEYWLIAITTQQLVVTAYCRLRIGSHVCSRVLLLRRIVTSQESRMLSM
jgi:hypothetical protein